MLAVDNRKIGDSGNRATMVPDLAGTTLGEGFYWLENQQIDMFFAVAIVCKSFSATPSIRQETSEP